ncbi:hypothetical protein EH183_25680 [Streptomyces sp. CB01881]|nr:hypothetical protein C2142_25695 [Streptomyces sp. CB01881]TYC71182.1 hypothetical protein EH183_25680 [Streptomyces sp. CB01881]
MSEPWSEASAVQQHPATDASAVPAIPKSLLEQLQELLASVTADLAELQSSGARASDRPNGGPSLSTSNGVSSSDA